MNKRQDYPGATTEAAHLDLPLPPLTTAATIALELAASFGADRYRAPQPGQEHS